MRCNVVVPKPVKRVIASWGLSLEAEDLLYARLQADLEYDHENKCLRLAAPSPTYIHYVEFQDPVILGIRHFFTFWLTYGSRDGCLYVRQCDHQQEENWGTEDEPER